MPDDADAWPDHLIVETGDSVRAWTPGEASPCDLPPSAPAQADALRAVGHPLVVIDPSDASRLADAFARAYGQGVRRADTLRTVVLVGAQAWAGTGEPLADSPLAWSAHVVLAAHAFAGTQTFGTATEAFARAHAALRSAQVALVDGLATQIDLGDARTSPRPSDSWWDGPTQTLLVQRGASARTVARPLARLVGRRDLFFPLESALSTLDVQGASPWGDLAPDLLQGVYAALGVDGDRQRDVVHATREDAGWVRQRVIPVLALGGADLDAVELPPDDDAVLALLRRFGPQGPTPEAVLTACRNSRSDADLGRHLFQMAGVSLSAWNDALAHVGRAPVANERGPAEAARALDDLRPLLRAALRHDAVERGDPALYHAGATTMAAAAVEAETAKATWEPLYVLAGAAAAASLNLAAPEVAALAASASSADDIRRWLDDRGADPADPEVLLQENCRVGRDAADVLLRAWTAFRLIHDQPLPTPFTLDRALDEAVHAEGVVERWGPVTARQAVARRAARQDGGGL